MSIKTKTIEQAKKVNYIQIIATAMTIGGMLWALAETVGDGRWANRKETEQAISSIHVSMASDKATVSAHMIDRNLHMPEHIKKQTFVEKAAQDVINKNVSSDLQELKEDFKDFNKSFEAYQREQRTVNRAILERLPSK